MNSLWRLKSTRSFYFTSWLTNMHVVSKYYLTLSVHHLVVTGLLSHSSDPSCSLPFVAVIQQLKLSIAPLTYYVVSAKCYKWTWKCNTFRERFKELKVLSQFGLLESNVWPCNQVNDQPVWRQRDQYFLQEGLLYEDLWAPHVYPSS